VKRTQPTRYFEIMRAVNVQFAIDHTVSSARFHSTGSELQGYLFSITHRHQMRKTYRVPSSRDCNADATPARQESTIYKRVTYSQPGGRH
jgi:hypothetical protein